MSTLAQDYESGKAWNERRAEVEKEGLKKFWQTREMNNEFLLIQKLGWKEYNKQKYGNY